MPEELNSTEESVNSNSKSSYDRFSLTLPQDINEWLYDFTVDIKKAGGYRVPKTLVVRAFIRAIKESDIKIDITNIKEVEGGSTKRGIGGKVSSDSIEDLLKNRIVSALHQLVSETE